VPRFEQSLVDSVIRAEQDPRADLSVSGGFACIDLVVGTSFSGSSWQSRRGR
jgi:hypothetical protein